MKVRTVPFFIAHQGCSNRCVFCNQAKVSGASERLPGETEIVERVARYRETAGNGPLEVAFFGGSFTSLPRPVQGKLLAPLRPLLASGEVEAVRISTRPDSIDPDSVAFLRERGVGTVEIGAQSLDDEVLELSGRGHGSGQVEQAVDCLRDAGMSVGVQLMPGLPGDTNAKSLASLASVLVMKPDFLRIYPTVVISGTPLEGLYRCGSYRPMTLDGAVRLCKMMLHECLLSGIPVIRMGLQPTTELLTEGVIVAGPYHPAFRQLVEAELCYDLMVSIIGGKLHSGDEITVFCAPAGISDVVGQKRANAARLRRHLGIRLAAVRPDPRMSRTELAIRTGEGLLRGSVLHDLKYGREVVHNG